MKLYIQLAPNNNLHDLILIDNTGQHCLLQDTLENCLVLFKKLIAEQKITHGISYQYDDSTHLVINYTNGKPVTTDGMIFSKS